MPGYPARRSDPIPAEAGSPTASQTRLSDQLIAADRIMSREADHRRTQLSKRSAFKEEFDVARPSDDVYAGLKDDIERGILTPGEHLVEDAICTRFGVSRTPVRNAIKRLEAEGLVSSEPNRGAFVASWTSDDAAEVMTIRSMLESHAAALAAQRRTPQDIERAARTVRADGTSRTRPAHRVPRHTGPTELPTTPQTTRDHPDHQGFSASARTSPRRR